MTRDPVSTFMSDSMREYTPETHDRKWEIWVYRPRHARTICVRLWLGSAELTIAHRCIGSNGCMSELNSVSCDVEHLPQLIRCLNRALAVAHEHGLIKQTSKR